MTHKFDKKSISVEYAKHIPSVITEEDRMLASSEKKFALTDTSGLYYHYFVDMLVAAGLSEANKGEHVVLIAWAFGITHKKLRMVTAGLKNNLDGHQCVSNKWRLTRHASLQPYVARTRVAESITKLTKEMYIVRPVSGHSGLGVSVIRNISELPAATAAAREAVKDWGDNIIVSEYISDVMTYSGRKFHMRLQCLVAKINGQIIKSIWQPAYGEIFLAGEKYDPKSVAKAQYDTHASTTEQFIPVTSLPEWSQVQPRIDEMLNAIMDVVAEHTTVPVEAANGFEILECDTIIRTNGQPICVEVNTRSIGFSFDLKSDITQFKETSKLYYTWIYNAVIHPFLSSQKI